MPVPGWTEVRKYRLYPLVVYSPAGVVQGFGAGRYEERHQDNSGLKAPAATNADVLGFTVRSRDRIPVCHLGVQFTFQA